MWNSHHIFGRALRSVTSQFHILTIGHCTCLAPPSTRLRTVVCAANMVATSRCKGGLVTLLQFHVAISLIGTASGLIVVYGLVIGRAFGAWTALFLATTILTSVTGFFSATFRFRSAASNRHFVAFVARSRGDCVLRVSARGSMALGLRNHRYDCTLSE